MMLRSFLSCCVVALSVVVAVPAQGALFLNWNMNGGPVNSLLDSVGTNHLIASGVDSNGGATTLPTYLPTGGVGGSGAYSFNPGGVPGTDHLSPTDTLTEMSNLMPSGGGLDFNWTSSFWIKTSDSTLKSNGLSPFAFQMPVLGERAGSWAFEMGVDGGKAGFFHWDGAGFYGFGNQNIADGKGHFVTFVHKDTGIGSGVFDIYIDGLLDAAGLNAHDTNADIANPRYRFSDIGRMSSDGNTVGAFVLDDVRLYNTALSATEIFDAFGTPPAPEPSSIVLLGSGALLLARRRRKS